MDPTARETQALLKDMASVASGTLTQVDVMHHYCIQKELGKGSFGSVVQALEKPTGNVLALKTMKKSRMKLANFLQEFCTTYFLASHPGVIRSFGIAFQCPEFYVFTMELAPCGDLCSLLEESTHLPQELVKRCAVQISDVLDFMDQQGLVHHDLKPENILLFDKECHCIKVSDFGFTQLRGTPIPSKFGTVAYMAPELCSLSPGGDSLRSDPSLDAWSFGVILFCLLTDVCPWEAAVPSDVNYKMYTDWLGSPRSAKAPPMWKTLPFTSLIIMLHLLNPDPSKRMRAAAVNRFVSCTWKRELPAGGSQKSYSMRSTRRSTVREATCRAAANVATTGANSESTCSAETVEESESHTSTSETSKKSRSQGASNSGSQESSEMERESHTSTSETSKESRSQESSEMERESHTSTSETSKESRSQESSEMERESHTSTSETSKTSRSQESSEMEREGGRSSSDGSSSPFFIRGLDLSAPISRPKRKRSRTSSCEDLDYSKLSIASRMALSAECVKFQVGPLWHADEWRDDICGRQLLVDDSHSLFIGAEVELT